MQNILTNWEQGIVKGFTDSGFKTRVQPLSAFQESYGLEADDEEGDGDEDDEGTENEEGETTDGTADD